LTLSVIILAGARYSGKSLTLKKAIKLKLHETWVPPRVVYPFKGKRICIYTSSPQEQRGVGFCEFEKVNRIISKRVDNAKSNNCALLILPFTLATNREGELNTNCITKPKDYLTKKLRVKKVRLTYLQKDSARGVGLMNRLMTKLGARPVIRRGERTADVKRQVNELWKAVTRVDA
jgi:hypothetical protein